MPYYGHIAIVQPKVLISAGTKKSPIKDVSNYLNDMAISYSTPVRGGDSKKPAGC